MVITLLFLLVWVELGEIYVLAPNLDERARGATLPTCVRGVF